MYIHVFSFIPVYVCIYIYILSYITYSCICTCAGLVVMRIGLEWSAQVICLVVFVNRKFFQSSTWQDLYFPGIQAYWSVHAATFVFIFLFRVVFWYYTVRSKCNSRWRDQSVVVVVFVVAICVVHCASQTLRCHLRL